MTKPEPSPTIRRCCGGCGWGCPRSGTWPKKRSKNLRISGSLKGESGPPFSATCVVRSTWTLTTVNCRLFGPILADGESKAYAASGDEGLIRFPADVFGDGSRGVTQPVGWASARGRRTRGGGGGTLERGGAG